MSRSLASLVCLTLLSPLYAFAKVRVVSTTTTPAAIATAIGGDRVVVTSLSKGSQDPHFIDPKPSYMIDLAKADLVLVIGLDLEVGYLSSLLNGARNPRILAGQPGHLDLSAVIKPLESADAADRSQGDIHPRGNPHYWLDPENGRLMARAITGALSDRDPNGKKSYEEALAAFEKTLDARKEEWARRMAPLSGAKIVTHHKSWSYFAARFGLEIVGYVEPKPGIPPTAGHVATIVKAMRDDQVRLLLMENFYDKRMPELIAEKTGATLLVLPNAVGGTDSVKTYFDLFDHIITKLEEAAPKPPPSSGPK